MRAMPSRPLTHPSLFLVLAFSILTACGQSPGSSGGGSGPESVGGDPGRAAFEALPLPEPGRLGADPEGLAVELFGAREPMEGRYSEQVETLVLSAEGRVLLLTQMELPDDSVRGLRYRLELNPEGGQWRLHWVGRQVLCRPGRGHEDWGAAPCL